MNDNYKAGDFIVVTQNDLVTVFEILGVDNVRIRLRDNLTLIESTRSRLDISELILIGKAQVTPNNIAERDLNAPLARTFSDYSEQDKATARIRYQYVSAVFESNPKSYSEKFLQPVIDAVSEVVDGKAPSARTLSRWIKSYISAGSSIRGLLPGHENKGNYKPKVDSVIEPYIQLAIDRFKSKECPTVNSAHSYMEALIENDNSFLSHKDKLKVPSIPTLNARIEYVAPKELLESRKGKRAANIAFKQTKLVREITLILQRAEIDHTQLDLFVVDDKTKMVLGRPWVTVLLDYKSKNVLGFYIGFENPSYLSVAKALQHAMSSKSYVKNIYPDIKNEWLCAGRPAVIATDRGKEFRGIAFEDACLDLNIIIQHNPAKHPWYKGAVERYFHTLNQELLSGMPGKVMAKIYDSIDYKPEKNGVISMSAFMEIFHIWVIDIFQCEPRTRKNIIPKDAWKEDLDRVPIVVEDPGKLKLILSENFTVFLGDTGIIKDHINYDSEELTKYRSLYGGGKMSIKRSRDNLGEIYVLNDKSKKYFKVNAVNQKYAKNLSLFQHKIHIKFAKLQLKEKVDIESISKAKVLIMQIVEKELLSSKSILNGTKQRLSRYTGIGQQEGGSTEGSVRDQLATSSSIPKPGNQKSNKNNVEPSSQYDGNNNEFDDELDL